MDRSGSDRDEYLRVYNEVMKGIAVGNGWQRLRLVEIENVGNSVASNRMDSNNETKSTNGNDFTNNHIPATTLKARARE